MKILIIGGTGFIGFNLLKKLKNLRFSITSISLSYPKKNNLISGVNYIKLDITNKNEIKSYQHEKKGFFYKFYSLFLKS